MLLLTVIIIRDFQWNIVLGTRLAFRELGLAIGLHAVHRLCEEMHTLDAVVADHSADKDHPQQQQQIVAFSARSKRWLQRVEAQAPLAIAQRIENFWLDKAHQQFATWRDHEDINEVMLATSLAPNSFLYVLFPPHSSQI